MNVRVHIERLVLDGFPVSRADAHGIGAALESHLSEALRERRLDGIQSVALPSVAAPPAGPGPPGTLGARVAGSIASALHATQR